MGKGNPYKKENGRFGSANDYSYLLYEPIGDSGYAWEGDHDASWNNKKETNEWEYPGMAQAISDIENRLKKFATLEKEGRESHIKPSYVGNTLEAVKRQLRVVDEAIRTEGENSSLLTYRRKLRQIERKLKSGKFID